MKLKRNKKHIKKVKKTLDYKIWKLFNDSYVKDSQPVNLTDRARLRIRMLDIPLIRRF